MTDLHDLARRVMNAETPADGSEILREAIEQLIGRDEPEQNEEVAAWQNPDVPEYVDDYSAMERNQLRHELLASIKPKRDIANLEAQKKEEV